MTCDEYRAGVLAGETGIPHADHLAACASCRADQDSLTAAAGILDDPMLWEAPPFDLEDRVVAAVMGSSPPAAIASGRWYRPTWSAAAITVAAALILVIAVSAAAIWSGLLGGPGPDWEIAISGTEQTPDAGGTVLGWNTGAGTRVAFDVTGVPPAPDGFVYELWFSAAEVHVSGGTFKTPEGIDLWVGVSRRDFPRVWVTLEPVDADSSPSRSVVLDTRRP